MLENWLRLHIAYVNFWREIFTVTARAMEPVSKKAEVLFFYPKHKNPIKKTSKTIRRP